MCIRDSVCPWSCTWHSFVGCFSRFIKYYRIIFTISATTAATNKYTFQLRFVPIIEKNVICFITKYKFLYIASGRPKYTVTNWPQYLVIFGSF